LLYQNNLFNGPLTPVFGFKDSITTKFATHQEEYSLAYPVSLKTALAWGEVGFVCVSKQGAGKQLRRLLNETTAAKTGPQAAPTQQNQPGPRKRNNSTWVLHAYTHFFLLREDFYLTKGFVSPL